MAQQSAESGASRTTRSSRSRQTACSCGVIVSCRLKTRNTGLVRTDLVLTLFPDCSADAARQNPMLVGDGGDDSWDELILYREKNFVRAKGTLKGFRPQVSASHCVDQLNSQTNWAEPAWRRLPSIT